MAAAAALRRGGQGYELDEYRRAAEAAPSPDSAIEPDPPPAAVDDPTSWDFSPGDRAAGFVTAGRFRVYGEGTEPEPEPAEPRWETWVARLRTDSRLQLIVLASVLLVLVAALLFPRKSDEIPISRIRHHAREFDGAIVTVKGTITEVFQVGSSYAYYLRQGRDTIVVFTRGGAPVPGRRVLVKGSVSTGYLEGVARAALFEQSSR